VASAKGEQKKKSKGNKTGNAACRGLKGNPRRKRKRKRKKNMQKTKKRRRSRQKRRESSCITACYKGDH